MIPILKVIGHFSTFGLLLVTFISLCECSSKNIIPSDYKSSDDFSTLTPTDFPQIPYPPDNSLTSAKILLGRYLFHDKRLSIDNSVACATCHSLPKSFSDAPHTFSLGAHNLFGKRNAPSLANVAYNIFFAWDGKFHSLEDQMMGPVIAFFELGNGSTVDSLNQLTIKLSTYSKYRELFKTAFGDSSISIDRIQKAIASFERTIISGNSSYDAYSRGDTGAITAPAIRGLKLFKSSRTNCSSCHSGFNFTDQQFHSNGIHQVYSDSGRSKITHDGRDIGKFKTPSLRNVYLTPPYMHDGSYSNLLQVLQNYNNGGNHNATQDSLIKPLYLNQDEVNDIIEFLKALSDSSFINNNAYSNPW